MPLLKMLSISCLVFMFNTSTSFDRFDIDGIISFLLLRSGSYIIDRDEPFFTDNDILPIDDNYLNLSFLVFTPCDLTLNNSLLNSIKHSVHSYRYYLYDKIFITCADSPEAIDRLLLIKSAFISYGIRDEEIHFITRESLDQDTDDIVKIHLSRGSIEDYY